MLPFLEPFFKFYCLFSRKFAKVGLFGKIFVKKYRLFDIVEVALAMPSASRNRRKKFRFIRSFLMLIFIFLTSQYVSVYGVIVVLK